MSFKTIEKNIQLLTQQSMSAKEYLERLQKEHSALEKNIHSLSLILMEMRSSNPPLVDQIRNEKNNPQLTQSSEERKMHTERAKNESRLKELLNQFSKVGTHLLEARKKYHNLTQELAREHFVLEQKRQIA